MKYRGTIAYRAGLGSWIPEGFMASFVPAWDFLAHEKYFQGPDRTHFMRGLSCMLHDSANQIADGFLGDWVLMLDTDHVFKSDAFYEMVTAFEDNDLDILVGFAQKRQPPYLPLLFKTNFDPLLRFEPIIPGPIEKNLLIPIDASGLACTMVRRRVFEAINEKLHELPFDFRKKFTPTFYNNPPVNAYNGAWRDLLNENYLPKDRRHDEFYWEDISFFWRAALLGFKAWCAPWVKFHHIETRLVTDDLIQKPKESPIPQ
jgi:GT2 family glycosyltransferase